MEGKKKGGLGIIIVIIILLLILCAIWFFLIKGKDSKTNTNQNNSSNTKENKETPKDNTGYEYDYKDGVLTQIVDKDGNPKQTYFIIDGVILVGNRHSYAGLEADTEGVVEKLAKEGYKKEGINSSFYLNEYIEVYLDTKYTGEENDVMILVVPNKEISEYEKMKYDDLEYLAQEKGAIMNYTTPDEVNFKYVNEGYVNIDYPEGKYMILFTYKGKIAYFINITETKEPTE